MHPSFLMLECLLGDYLLDLVNFLGVEEFEFIDGDGGGVGGLDAVGERWGRGLLGGVEAKGRDADAASLAGGG